MSLTSDEVNFLVYRYLLEAGKCRTGRRFLLSACGGAVRTERPQHASQHVFNSHLTYLPWHASRPSGSFPSRGGCSMKT